MNDLPDRSRLAALAIALQEQVYTWRETDDPTEIGVDGIVDLEALYDRLAELFGADHSRAEAAEEIRLAEMRGFARKLEGRYNFPRMLAGMGDHILAVEAENEALKAELAAAKAPRKVYVVSERYECPSYVFSYPPAYWSNAAPSFDVDEFIVDQFAEYYPEHAQESAPTLEDDEGE